MSTSEARAGEGVKHVRFTEDCLVVHLLAGRLAQIPGRKAVIDASGHVRLLADVRLPGPRRALVTILDDGLQSEETALLSGRDDGD